MARITRTAGVSIWMLSVCAAAFAGALLLWHTVGHTKHSSEKMLDQYREMLARSRASKARRPDAQPGEPAEGALPSPPPPGERQSG